MGKVDGIMLGLGYECKYRSENVSQYTSPFEIFGEVDFLHAFRTPSLSMLERAEGKKILKNPAVNSVDSSSVWNRLIV